MSSFEERTDFKEKKLLSVSSLFLCIPGFKYSQCGSKRIKFIPETPKKADNLLKKIKLH